MKIHSVEGAGGVKLHVREWGRPGGIPILLIHGWSQSLLCWTKQQEGVLQDEFRVVASDLRGHGMSDAPLQAEQYTDGDKWADDVAAIIDQLKLDRPILVGWSYGGFVISDYVRKHGQNKIAGINFVGAAVVLGENLPFIGPGFLENAPAACEADRRDRQPGCADVPARCCRHTDASALVPEAWRPFRGQRVGREEQGSVRHGRLGHRWRTRPTAPAARAAGDLCAGR
jgi:pimeloyl-ACP methyl ester carboxylesterase